MRESPQEGSCGTDLESMQSGLEWRSRGGAGQEKVGGRVKEGRGGAGRTPDTCDCNKWFLRSGRESREIVGSGI